MKKKIECLVTPCFTHSLVQNQWADVHKSVLDRAKTNFGWKNWALNIHKCQKRQKWKSSSQNAELPRNHEGEGHGQTNNQMDAHRGVTTRVAPCSSKVIYTRDNERMLEPKTMWQNCFHTSCRSLTATFHWFMNLASQVLEASLWIPKIMTCKLYGDNRHLVPLSGHAKEKIGHTEMDPRDSGRYLLYAWRP